MNWRRCAVCSHGAQHAIEKKIREGQSLELLAELYGISREVLQRHRDSHMNTQLPSTSVRSTVAVGSRMDAQVLFEEHEEVARECRELIAYARSRQHIQGWALGIREWRATLDQQARLIGAYNQVDPQISRAHSARVIEVVSRALEKFPEAKDQVLAAIDDVEEGEG
jgi:hypothetical protein